MIEKLLQINISKIQNSNFTYSKSKQTFNQVHEILSNYQINLKFLELEFIK